MRQFNITKVEFDFYLFNAIGTQRAKDDAEMDLALRVLEKFKAAARAVPPTADEIAKVERGQRAIASYVLATDDYTFSIEEDEYALILERLKSWVPTVPPVVGDEFKAMRVKVQAAEKI